MIKIAKTDEEKRIADNLEKHLQHIDVVNNTHRIQAVSLGDKFAISYLTSQSNLRVLTHFDITISTEICDILDFEIEEALKGRGYGRKIYEAIEKFSIEYGCKKAITSPSGEGEAFWPKMGFTSNEFTGFFEKLI